MTDDDRLAAASAAVVTNDPPVEVDQRWEVYGDDGTLLRRIRILALHPDSPPRLWIYTNEAGKMSRLPGELGICPELNLRYVFTLVDAEAVVV